MHAHDPADTGGCAVLTEHLAQSLRPFPGSDANSSTRQCCCHQVLRGRSRRLEVRYCRFDGSRIPLGPPGLDGINCSLLHRRVHNLDRCIQIGQQWVRLCGGELVQPHHNVITRLDSRPPLGVRGHKLLLHVAALHRRHGPAHVQNPIDLRPGARHNLRGLLCDHHGTGEDVVVLKQIRFVREHLLNPQ